MTGSNTNRSFTSSARVRRARWALACLLALAAAPALAQRAPAGMSTDTTNTDSTSVVRDSMSLSDRALMLASDVNRLILPGSRAPEPGNGRVQSVLSRALGLLGTPYRWGGTSPEGGFDCSGLVGYVFRNALGIELPRVSREMAQTGERVERSSLTAGDLVFFGKSGTVDHVGIYVGEGKFVHAPRTGRDVTVSRLDTGYWGAKFLQARRVQGI